MKIILASKSPRRREILTDLGLCPEIVGTDANEALPDGIEPHRAVTVLAERKAAAYGTVLPENSLLIAADTVVALDGHILGKPKNDRDAFEMLISLSGRRHEVYTGVALRYGDKTISAFESTEIEFRRISPEEAMRYIATGEPRDKAGAYGIQGKGGYFVRRIDGDYLNVVGLPVCLVAELAKREFSIDLFNI